MTARDPGRTRTRITRRDPAVVKHSHCDGTRGLMGARPGSALAGLGRVAQTARFAASAWAGFCESGSAHHFSASFKRSARVLAASKGAPSGQWDTAASLDGGVRCSPVIQRLGPGEGLAAAPSGPGDSKLTGAAVPGRRLGPVKPGPELDIDLKAGDPSHQGRAPPGLGWTQDGLLTAPGRWRSAVGSSA
jgi:hypothetical protein